MRVKRVTIEWENVRAHQEEVATQLDNDLRNKQYYIFRDTELKLDKKIEQTHLEHTYIQMKQELGNNNAMLLNLVGVWNGL